jgi:hypothetical protein
MNSVFFYFAVYVCCERKWPIIIRISTARVKVQRVKGAEILERKAEILHKSCLLIFQKNYMKAIFN